MTVFSRFPTALRATALAFLSAMIFAPGASAGHKADHSQRYVPGVWVDPDGCEHWVMDDGWEGYMTPNVTRDGIPVCRRVNACLVESSDQLFAVDKHYINPANRERLAAFFRSAGASAYIIYGHTDSDASDAYNMGLSMRRANAVAQIAQSVGARVAGVRGFGERQPIATNATAYGKQRNRRVEVICVR
ncbi:MAG: OmpA family protein [Rhodobacteraceae bacterium]|nr:OmpA family protein [Paracoccaceae bacterium]MCB1367696.1 OmpA family protein [Paracoccaceae bacterium]